MIAETKVYSNYIKRNNIVVKRDFFVFKGEEILVQKDDDGRWYAGQDDKCYTKKAAIYYYIKNRI